MANARTPVSDIQKQIEALAPHAVRGALDYLGVPGRVAGMLWDLYDELNPSGVSKPGTAGYNIPANWVNCSTPNAEPCISFTPTHYGGSWTYPNSCNGVGNCTQNLTLGGISPLPVSGDPWARIHFVTPGTVAGKWTVTKQILRTSATQTTPQWEEAPPVHLPQLVPEPDGVPYTVDPMAQPLGVPGIEAAPLPYWMVPYREFNPWRAPTEQPQRGPLPNPAPRARPEIAPGLREALNGVPGPSFIITPSGVTKVAAAPLSWPKPPGRGTKERKLRLAIGGIAAVLTNVITESKDFVEALWKALPKKYRTKPDKGRKKITVQAMLQDLYNHWGKVDLPQAMWNVISNQAQDAFYGKVGNVGKNAVKHAAGKGYYPGAGGLQLGGRYRPQAPQGGYQLPSVGDNLPAYSVEDLMRAFVR